MVVIFSGVMFVQAQETAIDPNAIPTITQKQVEDLGQQHQSNNRSVIYLDFEGVGDLDPINDFYNGGTSGHGNSGTDYGIQFTPTSLGLIDADVGGSGNTGNEPSGETVMFFLQTNATLNVAAGFTTGFSFYYAAPNHTGHVYVYDGLNGTGNLLADLFLPINGPGSGDPNGIYSNWDVASLPFAGTAHSIVFGGTPNYIVYDDVTFGSITPGPVDVPISDWAIYFGIFLIAAFMVLRYRRRLA